MRNKSTRAPFHRLAIIALAVSLSTQAMPVEQKLWRELAVYLQGKLVTITTKDGKSITGRSFNIRPDGIFINDPTPTVVPRDMVLSVHWEMQYKSQTRKLGSMLSTGYRHVGKIIGTPLGPFGLVELPAITAWGAAALPFCLLGDLLGDHTQKSGDFSILPDSPAVSK
jgi:hypothetical protein